ncbi:hypothetical protein GQ457_05G024670 [Hibiscus cannabinus]
MSDFGRVYSDNKRHKRFNIFKQNVALIDSFNNANNKPYNLAVNRFADVTNEEFTASRNGFKGHMCSNKATSFMYENFTALPSTVIGGRKELLHLSRTKANAVCSHFFYSEISAFVCQCCNSNAEPETITGCCWAFSAVAQELVDCDTKGEDQGCQGGLMDDAFQFIEKNKGLTTESNYPYKGVDGTCNSNEEANHAATINGFQDVPANSEDALQKAVANQPVSVAIDACGFEFQFYSSGVFTGSCGTQLDHGVTAVGYGEDDDGTKYWLVKNSWGTSWGEQGYIRMQRDVDAKEGLCGIAMQASYTTAQT